MAFKFLSERKNCLSSTLNKKLEMIKLNESMLQAETSHKLGLLH